MAHTCTAGEVPVHLPDGSSVCKPNPCAPGQIPTPLDSGVIACVGRILPTCTPPQVLVCSPTLPSMPTCRCEAPKALMCEARISYPAENPSAAVLSSSPGCDGAAAELAIAVALAKILGAAWQ